MNNLEHRVLRIEPINTAVQRCVLARVLNLHRDKNRRREPGAAHKGLVLLNIPFVHVMCRKTFTLFLLIKNFERRVLRIERTFFL